jgi:hypothetical protein
MSNEYSLFGCDTLEVINLDSGRGDFWIEWSLEQFAGPTVLLNLLDVNKKFKVLYIYPKHLKMLYLRFKDANPSGVETGNNSWYDADYFPAKSIISADDRALF